MVGIWGLWLVAGVAQALEFGSLTVDSALNQPFSASVVLSGVSQPPDQLSVGIASPDRFDRLGVQRTAVVDRLQVATEPLSGNRVRVRLATREPIDDPIVSFVLQVRGAEGTGLHAYTALLDPSGQPRSGPRSDGTNTSTTSTRTLPPMPSSARQAAGPGDDYRVRAGDTLWGIASARVPAGADVAQTAWAIYQANRSAFGGGPRTLRRGATLSLPGADAVRAVDRQTARRELSAASAPSPVTRRAATDEPPVTPSGEAPPPPESIGGAPRDGQDTADSASGNTSAGNTPSVTAADTDSAFGTLLPPAETLFQSPDGATDTAAATSANDPAVTGPPDVAATSQPAPATPPPPSMADSSTASSTPAASSDNGAGGSPGGSGLFGPRNLLLLLGLLVLVWFYLRRRQAAGSGQTARDEPGTRPRRPAGATSRHEHATTPTAAAASTDATAPGVTTRDETTDEPAWLAATKSRRPGQRAPNLQDEAASTTDETPETTSHTEEDETAASSASAGPTGAGPRSVAASSAPAAIGPLAHDDKSDAPRDDDTEDDIPYEPDRLSRPAEATPPGASQEEAGETAEPASFDTLIFEATEFEGRQREHDRGGDIDALDFPSTVGERPTADDQVAATPTEPAATADDTPGAGSMTSSPTAESESESESESASESEPTASQAPDLEPENRPSISQPQMIDPGEYDLYDAASSQSGAADEGRQDNIEIRLDLARMYIDMDDAKAARDLAEDVLARGDERQQEQARELLAELDAGNE